MKVNVEKCILVDDSSAQARSQELRREWKYYFISAPITHNKPIGA